MINNGKINEKVKDIKSKLDEMNSQNMALERILPTKRLVWILWSGKNNSPKIKPNRFEKDASLKLIFLFIKP